MLAGEREKFLRLGGTRVPLTVRAQWREHPKAIWGKSGGIEFEGRVIGDYTIPVAQRIPDEVLHDIRAHGGDLRLKFRLKPDGVLLGWDIERGVPIPNCSLAENATCTGTRFFSPGGDFLETRY